MELNVLFSPDVPRCLQLGFLIHHQGLHAAVEVNGAEAAAPKKGRFSFCLLSLLLDGFTFSLLVSFASPAYIVYIYIAIYSEAVFTHLWNQHARYIPLVSQSIKDKICRHLVKEEVSREVHGILAMIAWPKTSQMIKLSQLDDLSLGIYILRETSMGSKG